MARYYKSRRTRRRYNKYGKSRQLTVRDLEKLQARAQHGKNIWYDKVDRKWYPKYTDETLTTFGFNPANITREQYLARKRHGYKGRGDYWTAAQTLYNLPWRRMYNTGRAMYTAGRKAWTGRGDYSAPGDGTRVGTYGPAVDNQIMDGGNPPMTVNSGDDLSGDIIFSNREFVGNIQVTTEGTGTKPFENRLYAINPGLSGTFPFLSQLAKNFTLYEFMGLIFEYVPTSGEYGSSSNALGKVIMCTNYDPNDGAFQTARNMENYDYATSSKPSLEARHGVETAQKQSPLAMNYVRTGTDVEKDKIFTDIGSFQLATEGMPAGGLVGELWVSYKIRLSRSKINTDKVGQVFASASSITGQNNDNPFIGMQDRARFTDSIGVEIVQDNLGNYNTIVFPRSARGKAYRIEFSRKYTASVNFSAPPSAEWFYTGAAAPVAYNGSTIFDGDNIQVDTGPASAVQGISFIQGVWFNTTDVPSVKLTMNGAGTDANITTALLSINELNVELARDFNE